MNYDLSVQFSFGFWLCFSSFLFAFFFVCDMVVVVLPYKRLLLLCCQSYQCFLAFVTVRKDFSTPRLKRNSYCSCSKLTVFYFAYKSLIHLEFILKYSVKFRLLFIFPDGCSPVSSGDKHFCCVIQKTSHECQRFCFSSLDSCRDLRICS